MYYFYFLFILFDKFLIGYSKDCEVYNKSGNHRKIYLIKASQIFIEKNVYLYSFYKYIIVVPICFNNKLRRVTIRNTWGNIATLLKYRIIFAVGFTDTIADENDVLQFSCYDSYFNLTIITILTYKWTLNYSSFFDFFVRVDSDVYPNIQLLNLYINIEKRKGKIIHGYYYPSMKTKRITSDSNYIPYSIYNKKYLPEFVSGNFYILPKFKKWKKFIYAININSTKMIYREDIHMGLYFKEYNITIVKLNKIYRRKKVYSACTDYSHYLALHGVTEMLLINIYNKCSN